MTATVYVSANSIMSDSDTVASSGATKDYTETLLGLGEGPIYGPLNGLKSIYLGTTALVASDGTKNFKDIWCSFYPGEASESSVNFCLGGSTASTSVGVQLEDDVTVVRTGTHTQINVLDVRILVNSCIKNDGGSCSASWEIYYKRTSDTTWAPFGSSASKSITGKYNSARALEYRQAVSAIDETYDIKVVPTNVTGDTKWLKSITWESFQEITSGPLSINNTAMLYMGSRASNQYSQLPTVWGEYGGLYCRIPSNFNPATRTYSGTWDGTFTTAYTDDPVWVLYELIMNDRWGFAAINPEITIDKYDCYDASVWTSEAVSDGTSSGTQPRFTFNQVLTERTNNLDFLNQVAATFGGRCFDDQNGTIQLKVDKNDAAVKLFTPESVKDGLFNYSSSSIETRYNYWEVKFPNPDLQWEYDRRVVKNDAQIALYGKTPFSVQYDDCINVHEAIRRTYLRMMSACTETETVSFTTNRLGGNLIPFDIVLIADPDMAYGQTGRIKTISSDRKTITFRETLSVDAGVTYTVTFQTPSGIITTTYTASTTGTVNSLVFSSALDAGVLLTNTFSLGGPRPYRVLSISESNGNPDSVDITAINVNRAKWAAADAATYAVDTTWSNRKLKTTVAAPTAGTVTAQQATADGITTTTLSLGWTPSTDTGISYYKITYSIDGGDEQDLTQTSFSNAEYVTTVSGAYVFYVYAVTPLATSDALEISTTIDSTTTTLVGITGLQIDGQGANTVFLTQDVKFTWRTTSSAADNLDEETVIDSATGDSTFRDYLVHVYDISGNLIYQDITTQTYFTFLYTTNYNLNGGPYRAFTFGVQKRDIYGNLSTEAKLSVTNPAPAAVSGFTSATGVGTGTLYWAASTESDIAGYKVWASTTSGFTPGATTLKYQGPNTYYVDNKHTGATVYYRVAAYDLFDANTYVLSAEFSITIPQLTASELSNQIIDATKVASGFSLNQQGTSLPSTGSIGDVFVNSTSGLMYLWNGTQWLPSVNTSTLASTLSGYVTNSALNSDLANYTTTASLNTILSSYVTNTALGTTLSAYVTSTTLSSDLANYTTTASLNTLLSSYVTNTALGTTLSGYVTSSSLTSALSNYVTSTSLNSVLASYATTSAVSTALSSYLTTAAAASTYATAATTNALSSLIGDSSSSAILRMYTTTTPSDATARVAMSVSAAGTGGTASAYFYMDATSDGSRLVCAADRLVLTTAQTVFTDSEGNKIAVFNDTGINAEAITAGTLNVENLVAPGTISVAEMHSLTNINQAATTDSTLFSFIESGSVTSVASGGVLLYASIPYYEMPITYIGAYTSERLYFGLYGKFQRSTDNSIWSDVGEALTLLWITINDTSSHTITKTLSLGITGIDSSPINGSVYYRLVVYATGSTGVTYSFTSFSPYAQLLVEQRKK